MAKISMSGLLFQPVNENSICPVTSLLLREWLGSAPYSRFTKQIAWLWAYICSKYLRLERSQVWEVSLQLLKISSFGMRVSGSARYLLVLSWRDAAECWRRGRVRLPCPWKTRLQQLRRRTDTSRASREACQCETSEARHGGSMDVAATAGQAFPGAYREPRASRD